MVIQYGITRDVPTTLQRGGRGGRKDSLEAIFLIMYEPWVMDIKISDEEITVSESMDPDYPNAGKLTKYSTKAERTGVTMIKVIHCTILCLRRLWANYLGDKTAEGTSVAI